MTKRMGILLAVLFCVWASGGMAAPPSVFSLESPARVTISSDTFFWLRIPVTLAAPAYLAVPVFAAQGEAPMEPEEPEDPDAEPTPVRPDIAADLSGEGDPQPPPP